MFPNLSIKIMNNFAILRPTFLRSVSTGVCRVIQVRGILKKQKELFAKKVN